LLKGFRKNRLLLSLETRGDSQPIEETEMGANADVIRQVLAKHGRMPVDVLAVDYAADLYAAGLKSFASVQVMLALEEAFDIEFPERMLNRSTFASIEAIDRAVMELTHKPALAS
jgi:acyl carrier protein